MPHPEAHLPASRNALALPAVVEEELGLLESTQDALRSSKGNGTIMMMMMVM